MTLQCTLVESSSTRNIRQEVLSNTSPIHCELSASLPILLRSCSIQSVESVSIRRSYINPDTIESRTSNLNLQSSSNSVRILLLNESYLEWVSVVTVLDSDLSTTRYSSSVSLVSQGQLVVSPSWNNPSSLSLAKNSLALEWILNNTVDSYRTSSRSYILNHVSLSNNYCWIWLEWYIPSVNWSQESNLVNRSLPVWINLASILSRETYSVNLYRLISIIAISLLVHTLLWSTLVPVAPWSILLSKHTIASQSRDVVSQQLLWSLTSDTELTQILRAQHSVSNLSVGSSPSVSCITASQRSLVESYSESRSCRILLNNYRY